MMLGVTLSTNLSGRLIAASGRYKRFPVAGLAIMTAGLVLLAVAATDPSRTAVGVGLAVFGVGFGMVGQVLLTAVQNSVDRTRLGTATAATAFFRALGGAVGAAVLGAVFAARAGEHPTDGGAGGLAGADPATIADAVQAVLLVAAPISAVALLIVLLLEEAPLASAAGGR
jgi:MFS family permease